MKLDELLRRHDVCFFCGYTISIAGQTRCPECGKERPTAEEIERVRRAMTVGMAGVISLAVVLGGLTLYVLVGAAGTSDPFSILGVIMFGVFLAIMAAMLSPWFHEKRHLSRLFRSARRRRFVLAYPWVLVVGTIMLVALMLNNA